MAGFDPAIYAAGAYAYRLEKAWITGSSPVMTTSGGVLAQSVQLNSLNRTAEDQVRP
jgi:hypothetical protein